MEAGNQNAATVLHPAHFPTKRKEQMNDFDAWGYRLGCFWVKRTLWRYVFKLVGCCWVKRAAWKRSSCRLPLNIGLIGLAKMSTTEKESSINTCLRFYCLLINPPVINVLPLFFFFFFCLCSLSAPSLHISVIHCILVHTSMAITCPATFSYEPEIYK